MPTVAQFLAQLPESEHLALTNASGAGLFNARHAAQCLTDPGPLHETTVELLVYLSTAVEAPRMRAGSCASTASHHAAPGPDPLRAGRFGVCWNTFVLAYCPFDRPRLYFGA